MDAIHTSCVLAALKCLHEACRNDYNKTSFVQKDGVRFLLRIIHGPLAADDDLFPLSFHILSQISENDEGRATLVGKNRNVDHTAKRERLCNLLVSHLSHPFVQEHAAVILCNCSFETQFKRFLTEFSIAPHGNILEHLGAALGACKPDMQDSILAVMINVVHNQRLRRQFIASPQFAEFSAFFAMLVASVLRRDKRERKNGSQRMKRIEELPLKAVDGTQEIILEKALAVTFNCAVEDTCSPILFTKTAVVGHLAQLVLSPGARSSILLLDRAIGTLSRASQATSMLSVLVDKNAIEASLSILTPLAVFLQASSNSTASDSPFVTGEGLPMPLGTYRSVARLLAATLPQTGATTRVCNFRYQYTPEGESKAKSMSGISGVKALLHVAADPSIQGNGALAIGALAKDPQAARKMQSALRQLVELLKQENDMIIRNVIVATARLAGTHVELSREIGAMHLLYQLSGKMKR
jgi:hypothetical protein